MAAGPQGQPVGVVVSCLLCGGSWCPDDENYCEGGHTREEWRAGGFEPFATTRYLRHGSHIPVEVTTWRKIPGEPRNVSPAGGDKVRNRIPAVARAAQGEGVAGSQDRGAGVD